MKGERGNKEKPGLSAEKRKGKNNILQFTGRDRSVNKGIAKQLMLEASPIEDQMVNQIWI